MQGGCVELSLHILILLVAKDSEFVPIFFLTKNGQVTSLCLTVTSCKMVVIPFTLFTKSREAYCLKVVGFFYNKVHFASNVVGNFEE